MKTLAIYLMAGPETPELAEAAVDGGADLVELGFPFSDPLADGPVIRAAAERALAKGMRTAACLECLAQVRERVDVPLVPMTYSALLEAYGWERFAADARGGRDEPDRRRSSGRRAARAQPRPARRSDLDRRAARPRRRAHRRLGLPRHARGDDRSPRQAFPALAGLVSRARAVTDLPLYAGFGIATPEQAHAAAELADGVVVGSRAIEVAEAGPQALRNYVHSLRAAMPAAATR